MSDPKTETPPKKSPRKLIMMCGLGVLLAGGGAAGAWFALKSDNAGVPAARAAKPQPKALFTTLEPFTVNLQDARGERFAQVGITLQFEDPAIEVTLKDRLPTVRNEILLLLSSKQIEELLTLQGKQQLAQQIRSRTARAIGVEVAEPVSASASGPARAGVENPIREVLFSQFIVQ